MTNDARDHIDCPSLGIPDDEFVSGRSAMPVRDMDLSDDGHQFQRRRIGLTADLSQEWVEAISSATMDPRHDHLNKLLDEPDCDGEIQTMGKSMPTISLKNGDKQ